MAQYLHRGYRSDRSTIVCRLLVGESTGGGRRTLAVSDNN
jgi:hypothetical protein